MVKEINASVKGLDSLNKLVWNLKPTFGAMGGRVFCVGSKTYTLNGLISKLKTVLKNVDLENKNKDYLDKVNDTIDGIKFQDAMATYDLTNNTTNFMKVATYIKQFFGNFGSKKAKRDKFLTTTTAKILFLP